MRNLSTRLHAVKDSGSTFDQLLRTKLYRPRLPLGLVARPRLLDLMDEAEHRPVTLVSAPAGYGKSVLVSQWAERLGERVAWLSLDTTDSEERTFLSYFLAAVRTIDPDACPATHNLLDSASLPPMPVIAGYLLNDLDDLDDLGDPWTLVLDDCHRIDRDSPVHELLARLIEHPPPAMRLVLVTRRDPPLALAGLRASDRLREVRAQDLRFTGSEATEFLAVAADLEIGEEALGRLQDEVEGWAAGLRLASLALQGADDPDALLRDLQGGLPFSREYLLREVLAKLSPEAREILLTSSILNRFCEELVAALLSAPGSTEPQSMLGVGEFMAILRRSDLFTIPLDARGTWFRHHHLFQDLLEKELRRVHGTDRLAALHSQASLWFESQGLIDEALSHAVVAEDVERAARLVERHRKDAVNSDHWYELEKWLARLPPGVEQERVELLMARGWVLLHHFRFEAVFPLLDRVEALLGEDPDQESLRGEIALFRGYIFFFMGESATSLQFIEQALKLIPVSFYEARAQSEVIFALSSQMAGQKEEALRGLEHLLAHYESPSELRKTRLLVTQVFISFLDGGLDQAELANAKLRRVADGGGFAYAQVWSVYLQGLIHLHRFELDKAVDHLRQSVAQRFIHFKRAGVDSIVALMVALQAQGKQQEAQSTMELLQDYVASLNDPELRPLVGSAEARLAIQQGRVEVARSWLDSGPLPPEGAMIWWLDVPSVTRCRALLSDESPARLEEARTCLFDCASKSEAQHNSLRLIGLRATQALAEERVGRSEESIATLSQALELATKGRILLPFIELGAPMAALLGKLPENTPLVDRILAAFEGFDALENLDGQTRTQITPDLGRSASDDFTHRELDVLELLAERLQNKEIGARLGISSLTVQDHLKRIYQKLQVHGRRAAVTKAVSLGILDR